MHTPDDIVRLRLARQLIDPPLAAPADPAGVVTHLAAMQAQDYYGALWSVGLRCSTGTGMADIERAIEERRIVRTWPMRGTLHFVAPSDVRWMLAVLTPRVLARAAARHAQLGLEETTFERARVVLTDALRGGRLLARSDAMRVLESAGIATAGQRGYHVLWYLAQRAVLCCGPMRDRQQTFVLLDEWIAPSEEQPLDRDEALARLARRYFEAHGPATLADFAWWAGITRTDARAGADDISSELQSVRTDDAEYLLPRGLLDAPRPSPVHSVHLLSAFDEYMLGYTDRGLALGDHRETYKTAVSANGMFAPTIVSDGRIVGTWKRTIKRDRAEVRLRTFRELRRDERASLVLAAARYGEFLGMPVEVIA